MSDVVERLRKHIFYGDARLLNFKRHSPLAMEAADEIERLRGENERLSMELQILQIAIRNHAAAQDPDAPF